VRERSLKDSVDLLDLLKDLLDPLSVVSDQFTTQHDQDHG
jgi:hypothetical protein